jgi:hypothetical protein
VVSSFSFIEVLTLDEKKIILTHYVLRKQIKIFIMFVLSTPLETTQE